MAVGRPRAFDVEKALDQALSVFWEKGYEGASLPDLTEAMGINRPSLYAAFGNKEKLFRKALDRYEAGHTAFVGDALAQPTARKVVEHLFSGGIELVTGPRNPRGCLAVQAALVCGDAAETVRAELAARRKAVEIALRKRFQREVRRRLAFRCGTSRPCALRGHCTTRHGRAGRWWRHEKGTAQRGANRLAKLAELIPLQKEIVDFRAACRREPDCPVTVAVLAGRTRRPRWLPRRALRCTKLADSPWQTRMQADPTKPSTSTTCTSDNDSLATRT